MALQEGFSRVIVGKNISKLRGEGSPLKEAIARALDEARRSKKKKKRSKT